MRLMWDQIDSAIGRVVIVTTATHVVAVDFADSDERLQEILADRYGDVEQRRADDPLGVASRLRAYFAGDFDALEAIPVDPQGSEFQQSVWRELRRIPVGQTISYGQLATRLGQPTASRAVGMANSKNPVGIVIPCHRVIGADGQLTGYAGGVERKQWLLDHERGGAQLRLGL
ncbi:MAG: methylated-DNA--[protein]-cysteine S-methyltransferase [Gammaproteobacteria bacterium]|jgi:methylated-DNA-[protein]-cysteine S-methyltransferase